MGDLVKYETGDAFSTITMDDGRANVMSVAMLKAINAALDQAEAQRKIVLLTGRERLFSAGFDLETFKQGKQALFDMLKAGAETAERIFNFPTPVVVACNGHAIAMGVFLLLAGDYRIGVEGKFKIHANEVEIGLTLPYFAVEMTRQRLAPAAYQLATILAEPHTPEQARAVGFLDQVVPAEALMETARERAKSLGRLNMAAHTATKRRVREDALAALKRALERDVKDWTAAFLS